MSERLTKEMREFVPVLNKNGYKLMRTNGSHKIYSDGKRNIAVNLKLNRMVRERLIKENSLVL